MITQRDLDALKRFADSVTQSDDEALPIIGTADINTEFGDDGFDAEAFMQLPLPERFHAYMVREICSEEDYRTAMDNNGGDYLPMLYHIKKEMPGEFYAYFHDLLDEREQDYYHQKFIQSLHGIV